MGACHAVGRRRDSGSVSSAIRWHALARRTGNATPKRQGGGRRLGPIETYADVILGVVAKRLDITFAKQRTPRRHGVSVGIATQWRFSTRRQITPEKKIENVAQRDCPDVMSRREL